MLNTHRPHTLSRNCMLHLPAAPCTAHSARGNGAGHRDVPPLRQDGNGVAEVPPLRQDGNGVAEVPPLRQEDKRALSSRLGCMVRLRAQHLCTVFDALHRVVLLEACLRCGDRRGADPVRAGVPRTVAQRVDERRLATRRFAMLIEEGIEPHPGPAPPELGSLTERVEKMHVWHAEAAAARRDVAAAAACLAGEMGERSVYWGSLALQERARALEQRCARFAVIIGSGGTLRVRRSQWDGAPPSTPDTPITVAALTRFRLAAAAVAANARSKLEVLVKAVDDHLKERDAELHAMGVPPACAPCDARPPLAGVAGPVWAGPAPPPEKKQLPRVPTSAIWYLVGCPFGHRHRDTKQTQADANRRTYKCAVCYRHFSQRFTRPMPRFEERDARWVSKKGCRRKFEAPPSLRGATVHGPSRQNVGDVVCRWHNSGGLGTSTPYGKQKRSRYLRRVMSHAGILGLCETGLDEEEGKDAEQFARWDAKVNATMLRAQYWRRNTGLALLISRELPVSDVAVRAMEDPQLQCMIVDLTVRDVPMRVVLSHGDPGGSRAKKLEFYRAVRTEAARIARQDDDAADLEAATFGAGREDTSRHVVWLADHNMVLEPEVDEDQGTPWSARGAAHGELVECAASAGAEMGGGSLADAFRCIHGPTLRSYTHGVRRIDRAEVSQSLTDTSSFPWVAGVSHVEQEDLDIAVPASRGEWEVLRPGHKAVDLTLRFSNIERPKRKWVDRGRMYPRPVWDAALMRMNACLRSAATRQGAPLALGDHR